MAASDSLCTVFGAVPIFQFVSVFHIFWLIHNFHFPGRILSNNSDCSNNSSFFFPLRHALNIPVRAICSRIIVACFRRSVRCAQVLFRGATLSIFCVMRFEIVMPTPPVHAYASIHPATSARGGVCNFVSRSRTKNGLPQVFAADKSHGIPSGRCKPSVRLVVVAETPVCNTGSMDVSLITLHKIMT